MQTISTLDVILYYSAVDALWHFYLVGFLCIQVLGMIIVTIVKVERGEV